MRNEGEIELTPGLIPVDEPWPSVPEEGVALCLSGGGYRAMLFHLGGITRLNEMGQPREGRSRVERLCRLDHGGLLPVT